MKLVQKLGLVNYKALLMLLAIQTGYPEQAVQIIHDLAELRPQKTWWEFIKSYQGRAEKHLQPSSRSKNLMSGGGTQSSGDDRYEAERWGELLKRLEELRNEIPARQPCEAFIKWGPRVAHYSFRSAGDYFSKP